MGEPQQQKKTASPSIIEGERRLLDVSPRGSREDSSPKKIRYHRLYGRHTRFVEIRTCHIYTNAIWYYNNHKEKFCHGSTEHSSNGPEYDQRLHLWIS